MDAEFDDALAGVGKLHRAMIWDSRLDREREVELHWGLPSRDPDIFQIPLLKSETAIIDRPCLLLANEFGLKRDGRTSYSAELITDEPFFCIAGVWRPGSTQGGKSWPDSFAALTVSAYPDLAPLKDRHVAVVRPDDWFDWMMAARPPLDILQPFPENSFRVTPPIQRSFADMLGAD
jgi:putative SOS response-associated peptidase YedK